MTECNRQPILFASVDRRQIVADFQGGNLTSDGGLPLLREVDRKIGLIDALNAAIRDPRFQPLVEHDQRTILAQRIFAIAAGYEDLNDHQTLRNDTLLQTLTDRRLKVGHKQADALASPPTLCRLENRITRGGSGFCRWRMLRWCDRHDVGYIVGLAKNERLKRLARRSMVTARWRHRYSGQKQRLFEEFEYAAATWDRPRRVIAKAEHSEQGENPRFVVTNLPGDGQNLYEKLYCQRGEAENRIKEQQLGLFADRTSCHDFLANQFRVLLSASAYVLMETLRRVGLAGTELAKAQVGTIRLKLLKIGGRIVRSVRRVVVHLASAFPLQDLLRTVLKQLRDWRCLPAAGP